MLHIYYSRNILNSQNHCRNKSCWHRTKKHRGAKSDILIILFVCVDGRFSKIQSHGCVCVCVCVFVCACVRTYVCVVDDTNDYVREIETKILNALHRVTKA